MEAIIKVKKGSKTVYVYLQVNLVVVYELAMALWPPHARSMDKRSATFLDCPCCKRSECNHNWFEPPSYITVKPCINETWTDIVDDNL
jgi:hypothetical protein